jgi:hypothetical protein
MEKNNSFFIIMKMKMEMMKKKNQEIIIDGKGYSYIGEIMSDLPDNVMLNKVTTGCGMTSVTLENNVKYVLVVPYIALIINKVKWCCDRSINVLPVYCNGSDACEIEGFEGDKIITTYDSLGKVTEALNDKGCLNEWKVCVDEAHKLVDSAAFRPNAIRTVLKSYPKYKSFVFGTATPVKDEYQLPALRNIKKARVDWGDLDEVKVNFCQYDSKINDVAAIIASDFLTGERAGNAHIFINSVSSICSIVRKIHQGGFNPQDNIRIVCVDNDRNFQLVNKLPASYKISEVGSEVKKVNFYTSTAFEGCDIFDEYGKNFIVADGSKDHTKIDIVTLLPQIIGRVRNSKYKSVVDLIYSKNQYFSHISEDEFKNEVLRNIEAAKLSIEDFNNLRTDSPLRNTIINHNDNPYVIVDNQELLLNDSAWYNEMHNFSTLHQTYYVSKNGSFSGITDGTRTFNSIDYNYKGIEKIEIKGANKIKLGAKVSFKELCVDYISSSNNGETFPLHVISRKEPLIRKAFNTIGKDKMKALGYRKKDIQEALIVASKVDTNDFKIVKLLGLRVGEWISKSDAKNRLQKVYNQLQISSKAKASDLNAWYTLKPKK